MITAEAEPDYSVKEPIDELIETWNGVNGSKMTIHPETFKKLLKPGKKGAHPTKMSIDQFWTKATVYSAIYGNRERQAGMPDMKKGAKKQSGFWSWLFGLGGSRMGKKRLQENLKVNRSKKTAVKTS